MVRCDVRTAATSRSLDGVRLNTNALSGGTWPEGAVVSLGSVAHDPWDHTLFAVAGFGAIAQRVHAGRAAHNEVPFCTL